MFLEILPKSQKNVFGGISFLIKLQAAEAVTGGSLQEKVFWEISQNLQESNCARVSILIKLQARSSKNTSFTEYVWATAFKAGNLKLSEAATGDSL